MPRPFVTGNPHERWRPCATLSPVGAAPQREFKFQVGNYRAEIRESQSGKRQWYVIVHRLDSGDIAAVDRFETYDQAREAVLATLSRMDSRPNPTA